MRLRGMRKLAAGFAGLMLAASPAFAQRGGLPDPNHPGKAVYDKTCASCHDNAGDTRTPALRTLAAMPAAEIRDSLVSGKMKPMAASLSSSEVTSLVAFLTSSQAPAVDTAYWTDKMMCDPSNRSVDVTKPASFGGFGGSDLKGARMLSAAQAGLKKADMGKLEVAYAIGVPAPSMGPGVAVIGDTGFVAMGGKLVALDAAKGCVRWTYVANSRNTPAIGKTDGKTVLAFAVGRDINLVDAETGVTLWKASGQPATGGGQIRGGVIIYKDKIIVPISASGVGGGGAECCTGHGAVVALSAKDGKRLWEYQTMPDAQYNGEVNSKGAKQKGPSGAPIWAVPIADEKRNRIIVVTGENTSHPGTDTSDAVIALDANTGKVAWQFQAMKLDVWNMQCQNTKEDSGANCPWTIADDPGLGRDFDFGAGAVLAKAKNGKDVILAGQKSGDLWALDAETGKKLWGQRIGTGTALGGIHWGITIDGTRVFAAVADPKIAGAGPVLSPGLYAFDITTGKKVWGYDAKADCAGERGKIIVNCADRFGFSAAPMVIDGAVIAATLDGKVFVFDGATGKILKTFDFAGKIQTSNGIEAKGGTIDSHALSAGHGTIFISDGYGAFNQTPGNALIALRIPAKTKKK